MASDIVVKLTLDTTQARQALQQLSDNIEKMPPDIANRLIGQPLEFFEVHRVKSTEHDVLRYALLPSSELEEILSSLN